MAAASSQQLAYHFQLGAWASIASTVTHAKALRRNPGSSTTAPVLMLTKTDGTTDLKLSTHCAGQEQPLPKSQKQRISPGSISNQEQPFPKSKKQRINPGSVGSQSAQACHQQQEQSKMPAAMQKGYVHCGGKHQAEGVPPLPPLRSPTAEPSGSLPSEIQQQKESSTKRAPRLQSLLMRLIDDFLFITPSRVAAEALVNKLLKGKSPA